MNMTPIAQSLASEGRNGDSMLVHMTPNEVGGLQALAQSAGGSLTTNPTTGLPEANFLESILPTVIGLGASAMFPAAAPWMIGAGVGGGTALLTGDLNKGLMAGLGAFGGAGIGKTLTGMGGLTPAAAAGAGASNAATVIPPSGMSAAAGIGGTTPYASSVGQSLGSGLSAAAQNPAAFGSSLVDNLGGGLGAGAAGLGMLGGFEATNQPDIAAPTTSMESDYEGPYVPVEREVRYPSPTSTSTAEFDYFSPSNPVPGYTTFADGGMAQGFQTFGGVSPTENQYAFDPDDARFRNELEKIRILGRQTSAGIPMNVSGIDQQGKPIYEQSYTFNPSELAKDARGLLFQDMSDTEMEYLKNELGIKPSPETQVNPPTLTGGQVTPIAPKPAPKPAVSTREKVYQEVQKPPPTPTPEKPAPKPVGIADILRGQLTVGMRGGDMDALLPASRDPEKFWGIVEGTAPKPEPEFIYKYVGGDIGSERVRNPKFTGRSSYEPDRAAAGGVMNKAAGGLAALAAGGEFLEDGSFVVDARTVAELGNGSSNAGMELLMQLGGRPVQGPGDGVSDSIPATIDGERAAAVARDEVIFDPESVARIGGGDPETGARRLYSLMRKAEEARKEADRGEPSGAGLEALRMAGAV